MGRLRNVKTGETGFYRDTSLLVAIKHFRTRCFAPLVS